MVKVLAPVVVRNTVLTVAVKVRIMRPLYEGGESAPPP
jgi:hypothetical protein